MLKRSPVVVIGVGRGGVGSDNSARLRPYPRVAVWLESRNVATSAGVYPRAVNDVTLQQHLASLGA
jgi:hypothetical protein